MPDELISVSSKEEAEAFFYSMNEVDQEVAGVTHDYYYADSKAIEETTIFFDEDDKSKITNTRGANQ